ncbi:MAG: ATP-binding protein [Myxococcota bacterium]
MPPAAEKDFDLEELTTHHYEDYVLKDTFKPGDFDITRRAELAALAGDIMGRNSGSGAIRSNSEKLVSWSTVGTTGWKLLVLAPLDAIYAPSNALGDRLFQIGALMVFGLIVFYLLFFAWLYRRSRTMAEAISTPLKTIGRLVEAIAVGRYSHASPQMQVQELQKTADSITYMGGRLGEVNRELERARDLALESSRLKSQFIATVSHEIRTPLSVIVGSTEILKEELPENELTEFVTSLDSASHSLLSLIEDMLDFSRMESERLVLEHQPFEPRRILQRSVDMLQPSAKEKELVLELYVADEVPDTVLGDAHRFQQVALNLMRNAIRFTDRGRVDVSVKECDGVLELRVKDTGIGIAEGDLDKLFQPFIQVTTNPAQRRGGTGLGLSICKRIMDAMGGEISVDSQLGEGSTFVVRVALPIANEQEASA